MNDPLAISEEKKYPSIHHKMNSCEGFLSRNHDQAYGLGIITETKKQRSLPLSHTI